MNFAESIFVALFCMLIVFIALACLFALIKLFSFLLGIISTINKSDGNKTLQTDIIYDSEEEDFLKVKLYNVDEATAAMIMAIVSDETGIPLSELCFKHIKLLK